MTAFFSLHKYSQNLNSKFWGREEPQEVFEARLTSPNDTVLEYIFKEKAIALFLF